MPVVDEGQLRIFGVEDRNFDLRPDNIATLFETGEWGIVVGPSTNRAALARPRVKLITDRAGQVFAKPKEIDLGAPSQGRRFPRITGIIEPTKARFNVTGVLMAPDSSAQRSPSSPASCRRRSGPRGGRRRERTRRSSSAALARRRLTR
jgi:hypothetical protein